jgi:hypothetical protein
MGKADRGAYAPPSYVFVTEEGPRRGQALVVTLMCVVVAGFAGLVWNVYGGGEPARVRADEDYKIRPAPGAEGQADAMEANTLYDALEGRGESGDVATLPPPEEPLTMQAQAAPPTSRPGPPPRFTADGPIVAQVAAVRTQGAAQEVWRRMSARSPRLFSDARADIERADLGARGVYHRVHAGYFADRANAGLFCDRIRALGQDCIVMAR